MRADSFLGVLLTVVAAGAPVVSAGLGAVNSFDVSAVTSGYDYFTYPQSPRSQNDTYANENRTNPNATSGATTGEPEDLSFLSFEEWRSLHRAGSNPVPPMNRVGKPSVISTHDTIGDDLELDLSFLSEDSDESDKEARTNHASTTCAASIVKTNPEMRGASAILSEYKDTYMLNPCNIENKFVIIELCQDILVDTVVLANYEFFSSMVRHFRVSVSDIYPVKPAQWTVVGEFEARNIRDVQSFHVKGVWARYLRLEFLTHYGHEFYCPLSLVRVHGTTMIDDYKTEVHHPRAANASENQIKIEKVNQNENNQKANLSTPPNPHAQANPVKEDQPETNGESAEVVVPDVALNNTVTELVVGVAMDALKFCLNEKDVYIRAALLQVSDRILDAPLGFFEYYVSEAETIGPVIVPAEILTPTDSSGSSSPTPSPQSQTQSPAQQAQATQESVYKTIMKRLVLLEANATLSLQYIEEQSRMLRDAVTKIERRQSSKITDILNTLNATASRLDTFKEQFEAQKSDYSRLWQSTVLELESQRKHSEKQLLEVVIFLFCICLLCVAFDVYLVYKLNIKIV